MDIIEKNNKIYFDNDNKSYGNITLENDSATIELIKVLPEYRGGRLGSSLLSQIIEFISENFEFIRKIELMPLSLDKNGLDHSQLMSFYERYGFNQSPVTTKHRPYLMVKHLSR